MNIVTSPEFFYHVQYYTYLLWICTYFVEIEFNIPFTSLRTSQQKEIQIVEIVIMRVYEQLSDKGRYRQAGK